MKIAFESANFRGSTLALVEKMDNILTQYEGMGYTLTIRQLYYQLVSRNVVPNSQRSYKRVVDIAGKGRMAGMLDWSAIEDRARGMLYPPHWKDPATIVRKSAEQFRVDRWINQPKRVEIMLEKDALAGVLEPVCRELDVRLWPNKGYASLSMMFNHGRRLHWTHVDYGKEIHVIYFGDHDPSGLDMDRDIIERLYTFSGGTPIRFKRIALTMEQIEEYDPPPQWAKATDSRTEGYVAEYGEDVWELDALDPPVLAQVARGAILECRDESLYADLMEIEQSMRDELTEFADDYKERFDNDELDYLEDWYKELAY
jgi:hypothetical protein